MTNKAKSATPATVSYDYLAKLEAAAQVERVDKKALIGNAPAAEEHVIEMLLSEGYTNAEEAFAALYGTFGITRYADKHKLAEDGTPFFIQRIVQQVEGAFNGEDNWAAQIVTADGEAQILTMDRNPQRDKFMFTAALILKSFGVSKNPAVLQNVVMANGNSFYSIEGAPNGNAGTANNPKPVEQVTYDA